MIAGTVLAAAAAAAEVKVIHAGTLLAVPGEAPLTEQTIVVKKGKIVEPATDAVCPVCKMKPAKYPQNKCQVQSKDGKVAHFCSTQCMFNYLENRGKYMAAPVTPFLIWVMGMDNNLWIAGRTAYYVVESGAKGPMGPEALPFNALSEAKAFAAQQGGSAVIFGGVTTTKIMAK